MGINVNDNKELIKYLIKIYEGLEEAYNGSELIGSLQTFLREAEGICGTLNGFETKPSEEVIQSISGRLQSIDFIRPANVPRELEGLYHKSCSLYDRLDGVIRNLPDRGGASSAYWETTRVRDGELTASLRWLAQKAEPVFALVRDSANPLNKYIQPVNEAYKLPNIIHHYCDWCKGGLFKFAAERVKELTGFTVPDGFRFSFGIDYNTRFIGVTTRESLRLSPNLVLDANDYHRSSIYGEWGYCGSQNLPVEVICHEFQHLVWAQHMHAALDGMLLLTNEGLSESMLGNRRITDWDALKRILGDRKASGRGVFEFNNTDWDYTIAQFFIRYLFHYDKIADKNGVRLKEFLKELAQFKGEPMVDFVNDKAREIFGKTYMELFASYLNTEMKDFEACFGPLNFNSRIAPMGKLPGKIADIPLLPTLKPTEAVTLYDGLQIQVNWEIEHRDDFTTINTPDGAIIVDEILPENLVPKIGVSAADIKHHVTKQKEKWQSAAKMF